MSNPAIENVIHAMQQQDVREQATAKNAGNKVVVSSNDKIMTRDFADKILAEKQSRQHDADTRKEATYEAGKAEAAEIMAEIAVRDAVGDGPQDVTNQ